MADVGAAWAWGVVGMETKLLQLARAAAMLGSGCAKATQ